MLHQSGVFFGDMQKMMARALHESGATDREIADQVQTSVNNIRHWRGEESLPENLSPEARARAEEEAYRPPVRREPAPRARRSDFLRPVPPSALPGTLSVAEAQVAFIAPVQPTGDNALEIGDSIEPNYSGKVFLDLEELLRTRLLVQGNSGCGKSHLLRRLLEESTGIVQQIIIDPEGDFVSMGETFGHIVVEAQDCPTTRLVTMARRARQHRANMVLSLEGMEPEQQMVAVAEFLGALFDTPSDQWFPAMVVVDEAHLFASSVDTGEDKEIRRLCRTAMSNLMCRGRKRGLAGVIATQRLAKLDKNVAAEASNFLMGRTFMDIDLARACDLLGMSRPDGERVRNLSRGEFLGLGPAIARRAVTVKVGSVMTKGKASGIEGLVPLPTMRAEDLQALMLAEEEEEAKQPLLRVVGG